LSCFFFFSSSWSDSNGDEIKGILAEDDDTIQYRRCDKLVPYYTTIVSLLLVVAVVVVVDLVVVVGVVVVVVIDVNVIYIYIYG
jgi:hypothetical protein